MTKQNMAIFIAFITGTLSGQHIDHVSMELLKRHIPYVLDAYVPVEVYGDGNCFFRAVSISCYGTHRFWAVLKLLALFEVKDHAEYYTAGSNACKDYMGELATFAPERRLDLFEEIGRIGQHQGPCAFFAVANVVQGSVGSVHPLRRVNVPEELDYTFVAPPRPRRGSRQVRATLMWTKMSVKSTVFNHIVSLLEVGTCIAIRSLVLIYDNHNSNNNDNNENNYNKYNNL